MDLELINPIITAVLYEGYLLYPYRATALKNQQRLHFGTLYPQPFAEASGERSSLGAECLVTGEDPQVEIRARFLQAGELDAVEREVIVSALTLGAVHDSPRHVGFEFAAASQRPHTILGEIMIVAQRLRDGLWKLAVEIRNVTQFPSAAVASREEALLRAFASTHVIIGARGGEFVSLFDPPAPLKGAAAACKQNGLWPVLVGDPAARDMMLWSPIILYDYPQVAPESAGDFFDATEIDELLTLRVMTLSDEEKRAMRDDDRTQQILERIDALPPDHHAGLHGAIRLLRPASEEPRR